MRLENVRLSYLGKKGIIKAYLYDQKKGRRRRKKRNLGAGIKVQRNELFQLIMNKEYILKAKEINFKLQNKSVNIKLTFRPENIGRDLPVSKVINEVDLIFAHMGFKTVDSPDTEDEFHVFVVVYRLSYPAHIHFITLK